MSIPNDLLKEKNSIQGEDGEWLPVEKYLGCCDCGLVHQLDYRLIDTANGNIFMPHSTIQLQVRTNRDRELTKEARENKNFVCSIKRGKNGNDTGN